MYLHLETCPQTIGDLVYLTLRPPKDTAAKTLATSTQSQDYARESVSVVGETVLILFSCPGPSQVTLPSLQFSPGSQPTDPEAGLLKHPLRDYLSPLRHQKERPSLSG